MRLAVLTRAGDRDVMSLPPDPERLLQVLAQRVEVGGRYLERRAALVAGEVPVHGAGEMEDRGVLVEVRVHDDLQRFKLFEDTIDSRRADVGLTFLNFVGDLLGGEMTGRSDQDFGDGALGDGDPLRGGTNRRENIVDFGARAGHRKTLGPRD